MVELDDYAIYREACFMEAITASSDAIKKKQNRHANKFAPAALLTFVICSSIGLLAWSAWEQPSGAVCKTEKSSERADAGLKK